ncbi:MAG: 30S ribosomal protein S12 methylthiotransferase RimO [Clostridia bacterium]|nr:30S ribosomal protein S12 methylthiotransferase RimO [Clostridia bacterium]
MEKKNIKKLVGVVSLGCDKNRVDTEHMLSFLRDGGYGFTSDPSRADIIIVNTCGFIANARKESMDTIFEMAEYKKLGSCEKLVVTGCMPQRWLKEMRKDLPEVDIFLGINQYQDIVEILDRSYETNRRIIEVTRTPKDTKVEDRMITTPKHYAYLKIADGCNNFCTFCTIPHIRGRYRSKAMSDIIEEAESLVNAGATELILVAQDVTRYGSDFTKDGKPMLVDLIRNLSEIKRLKWIRLLYCYPEQITDELLDEMMNNPKLCNYLDMPLQHVADGILRRMNRRIDNQGIIDLITKIRSLPQKVAIRTTFMIGFPGETEDDFEELCEFIKKYPLDHVGFFAYSREEGTPSAQFPNQVPEKIKQKRLIKLVKLQKKVAKKMNKAYVGKMVEVVYEGIDYSKALFFGRTQFQSPEIDTLVYFKSKERTDLGLRYKIKIKAVKGYDLFGEKEL